MSDNLVFTVVAIGSFSVAFAALSIVVIKLFREYSRPYDFGDEEDRDDQPER